MDLEEKITLLKKAIQGHNVIKIRYLRDREERTINPHVLGKHGRSRTLSIRGYQTNGPSNRKIPDWRSFALKDVAIIILTDEIFDTSQYSDKHGYKDYYDIITHIGESISPPSQEIR